MQKKRRKGKYLKMKKFKRIIAAAAAFAVVFFAVAAFASCGKVTSETTTDASNEKKYSVVCSSFPQYDWVRVLLGDRMSEFDVLLLSGKGADMHSYQPTAEDIKNIGSADMFVYVGGESEDWVGDVEKSVNSDKTVFVSMTDILGSDMREEETALEAENDEHDEHEHEHGDGEVEYDEHVWLSLKNAQKITAYIASELAKLDPDGKETYENNLKEYLLQLAALDAEYKKAVENGARDTVVFADRFPFLYMMKDYGIKYHAAFSGCSAESEASFKTITALSRAADEINTDTILITETSDGSIADAVISGMTDKSCQKAVMNSMQSVTATAAAGETYLNVMTANLESLKKALG